MTADLTAPASKVAEKHAFFTRFRKTQKAALTISRKIVQLENKKSSVRDWNDGKSSENGKQISEMVNIMNKMTQMYMILNIILS